MTVETFSPKSKFSLKSLKNSFLATKSLPSLSPFHPRFLLLWQIGSKQISTDLPVSRAVRSTWNLPSTIYVSFLKFGLRGTALITLWCYFMTHSWLRYLLCMLLMACECELWPNEWQAQSLEILKFNGEQIQSWWHFCEMLAQNSNPPVIWIRLAIKRKTWLKLGTLPFISI